MVVLLIYIPPTVCEGSFSPISSPTFVVVVLDDGLSNRNEIEF
jgi:hypothetical protein